MYNVTVYWQNEELLLLFNYLKVTTQGYTNEPVNLSQYHLSCLHCVSSPSYSVS